MIKVKIRDIMMIEPVGKKLISYEWGTPAKSYNVFKVIDVSKDNSHLSLSLGNSVLEFTAV